MKFMVKSVLAAATFAFAFVALDTTPVLADGHMAVIKERKALMKTVGKSNKVIKKYKKGKASADEAIKAARALRKAINASLDKALYPKGSTRPDVAAKKTRAKAKLLAEWDGYVKAGKKTAKRATEFIKLVKAGDAGAKKVKLSCGGCHKPYRGKKVKK